MQILQVGSEANPTIKFIRDARTLPKGCVRVDTLYVSGRISGIADYVDVFEDATRRLEEAGFASVINPVEVQACRDKQCGGGIHPLTGEPLDHTWECFMRHDIKALMDCDAVATLEGWEASLGAMMEVGIARQLHMPVLSVEQWIKMAQHEKENA